MTGSIRSRISRYVPGPPSADSAFASTSVPGRRTNVKTTTATAAAATAPNASASREAGLLSRGCRARSSRGPDAHELALDGGLRESRTGQSRWLAPARSRARRRRRPAAPGRRARERAARRAPVPHAGTRTPACSRLRAQPAGRAEHQHLTRADAPSRQPRHLREGVALDQPQVDDELVVRRQALERVNERLAVGEALGRDPAPQRTPSAPVESTSRPRFLNESAAMFAATR